MRQKNGFTLIELMIVVVIIGILAAVAVPKFTEVSRSAKEAEAGPILKQLYTLQERYKQKYETYASDINDLEGGGGSFTGAKYYDFSMTSGGPTDYLACANPKPGFDLSSFSIDAGRTITKLPGGC